MINTYGPPSLRIRQLLETETSVGTPVMAAFIAAPRYLLSRKARETLPSFEFDSAGASLPFKYLDADAAEQTIPTTYAVDAGSLKLYGTGLEAQLATFGADVCEIPDISTPNVIRMTTNMFKGGTLATLLRGRAVAVGDIVYTTGVVSGAQTKRTVRSFIGKDVAAAIATPGISAYNPAATTAGIALISGPSSASVAVDDATLFNGLAVGSKYGNEYGEEYIVTVTTGGLASSGNVVVAVSTVSGHFSATGVACTNASNNALIGNTVVFGGCAVTIGFGGAATAFVQGQVFRFSLKGSYTPITMGTHLSAAGTYTGTKDTTYLIEVTGTNTSGADFSGATVRITDTAGVDDVIAETTIAEATNFDLGALGLTAKFEDLAIVTCKLRVGDIFYVTATAAYQHATEFDKIVLDGPAVDTALFPVADGLYEVQMRLGYTGEIAATASVDEVAWTKTGNVSLDYEAGLSLFLDSRNASYKWCAFVDTIGDLEVSFRAIVPVLTTDVLQTAGTAEEITEKAGPDDLDNDLGYAVARAWEASGGKTTYFLNTGGLTQADFEAAFTKISSTKATYALGIVTADDDVVDAARAHAVAMSAESVKNFRKIYFGVDSPGRYRVLELQSDDQYYTCTISAYGPLNRLVTLGAGTTDFTTLGLVAGDLVVLPNDDEEHEIESVLSATEILLVTGPASPVSPAVPFYLDKIDTVTSQKAWIRAKARRQAAARATMVWCENGTATINGDITVIPNRFVAAYVAGLRAGLQPQQGMTRHEIPMIENASAMYTRYTPTDLNEVAADGVLIITQDLDSGKVYIRHQLTTDSNNGILFYEDNVYPIIDYLSFQFDDALDPYIGKKNVTQATITEMRNDIADIAEAAKNADYNSEIGPLIVGYSALQVVRSTLAKDRVDTSITVEIPAPLNTIVHTIKGSYSSATPS